MSIFILAAAWLIMAVVALVMAVIALRYTHDAPGPIAYIRAILFGSAINYLAYAALVVFALPGIFAEPRAIPPTGIILTIGFFAQTLPVIIFELYLIERIDWLKRLADRFRLP